MKLTKERLKKIVLEEYASLVREEDAPQGGDDDGVESGEEQTKAAAVAEDRMETYMAKILERVSNEEEFAQTLTAFLKLASQHPSIKPNVVRRVLLALAKNVTQDAKA